MNENIVLILRIILSANQIYLFDQIIFEMFPPIGFKHRLQSQ